ncbi:MAG TPA: hypothetical protein DIU37_03980 [Opitutae bacterium]|nr:hypothetical protein [Opitutae bacterium]
MRGGALLIMLGTFVVILFVVIFLTRTITRPILKLNTAAHNIAEGDLVTPIPHIKNQNEIGVLAASFKDIQNHLGSLVSRVQNSIKRLGVATRDMIIAFKQQSQTIHQTEQTSIEITQAAKKIAETVHELTRTMEEVNHVAHGTARVAEAGLGGLQEIETTMSDLQSSTQSVSEQLNTIEKKADSIRSIVTTMTKVTDQANLLSLNAAIQARKAGEHGKGFNIVAQEIRRMADQTAIFTLDIENTVKDMLESVQVGVNGMHSFSLNVQFSTENIASISNRLSQTIQKIQGLPLRLEEVFRGMQSQTKEAGQIKNAMELLSKTTRETVEALSKTDSALGRLEEIASALEREIKDFKTKDSV